LRLTILAPPAPTTQPAPNATRGSGGVAGSDVGAIKSLAKHAAAVGPAVASINVPNLICSKHERAARAQAETWSLKHKLSEMFENLDAGKAKSAELARIVEAQKTMSVTTRMRFRPGAAQLTMSAAISDCCNIGCT
jgi:hypothetical protein